MICIFLYRCGLPVDVWVTDKVGELGGVRRDNFKF